MNHATVQDVIQKLQADDPLDLLQTCGSSWRASLLEERRFSRIYALTLQAPEAGDCVQQRLGSADLILKQYRATQPERRQKEFDDLCTVYEAVAERASGGVVKPVAVYADLGAVITARAPGVAAGPLVRDACRVNGSAELLARAASLCVTAGSWLAEFQRLGARRMSGRHPRFLAAPADVLSYLEARIEALRGTRLGIDRDAGKRLLDHVERTLASLSPGELEQVTWSHADFGPHNLLADDDRITVLDFELAPEHPYFDAAYFCESLAGLQTPRVDASRVARLQRAFLSAYGRPRNPALFDVFRLRHLLCSYVSQTRVRGLARIRAWPALFGLRKRLLCMARSESMRRDAVTNRGPA